MIPINKVYVRMTRISERYLKLKKIFDNFCHLAEAQLTDSSLTVQGITFFPNLERNRFDVSFAGKTLRFSFFVAEDEMPSLKGFIECNPIGRDKKPMDIIVGKFSFNGQAETAFRTEDGDPLYIDSQWAAGQLVLYFLSEAIDKMTKEVDVTDN